MASEPTVLVVGRDLVLRDVVPLIRHDLSNAVEGERTMLSYGLFPVVKEGIVQRRHALCPVGRQASSGWT